MHAEISKLPARIYIHGPRILTQATSTFLSIIVRRSHCYGRKSDRRLFARISVCSFAGMGVQKYWFCAQSALAQAVSSVTGHGWDAVGQLGYVRPVV